MIDCMHRHIRRGCTDVMAFKLNLCMRGQRLRQIDWAGKAHSAQTLTPLVGGQLFRALAPAFVSSERLTNTDFVAVGASRLPSAVLTRPRMRFEVPIAAWLGERAGRGGTYSPGRGKYVYMHAPAPAPNTNA